nr:MAG TPA: hypothetical protein [Caudoviricetes sp.]
MWPVDKNSAKFLSIDFFHVNFVYTHILHDYFLVVNRFYMIFFMLLKGVLYY